MSITIHRNLNDKGGEAWVLTCKEQGRRRVPSAFMMIERVKVSASTLARIRTAKGDKTPSGAKGLGKRTVGAWLVGSHFSTNQTKETGSTIHFNPFKDDTFMIQTGGVFSPLVIDEPILVHFKPCGNVAIFQH
tara:strand:+ start:553 stop:951 length:399 start_codon:yes stop_codon:yes gene_type:complete